MDFVTNGIHAVSTYTKDMRVVYRLSPVKRRLWQLIKAELFRLYKPNLTHMTSFKNSAVIKQKWPMIYNH